MAGSGAGRDGLQGAAVSWRATRDWTVRNRHGQVVQRRQGVRHHVQPDGGRPDVFVHFSAIEVEGVKELQAGDKVEYEVTEGPKGPQVEPSSSCSPSQWPLGQGTEPITPAGSAGAPGAADYPGHCGAAVRVDGHQDRSGSRQPTLASGYRCGMVSSRPRPKPSRSSTRYGAMSARRCAFRSEVRQESHASWSPRTTPR
jgi:cold shock CspA family protein